MGELLNISTNNHWYFHEHPKFTIITPVYNRKDTIQRTMDSVEKQTFRDIEYIIIDDGSVDSSSAIIETHMNNSLLPIMYIKKQNGGVHTARNMGYKYSRGELIICIDSDDELLPNACEIFCHAWDSIPDDKKSQYWQMKALCVNHDGKLCSTMFPDNINDLSIEEAYSYFSISKGEQLGCRVSSILKSNLFPEPEKVKFVNECVVWLPLERKYLSWGINEIVRIYHTDGQDRLSGVNKKSLQSCINALWNSVNELNNSKMFIRNRKDYMLTVIRYCVMANIVKRKEPDFYRKNRLKGFVNNMFKSVFWIPSMVGSFIYEKYKLHKEKS